MAIDHCNRAQHIMNGSFLRYNNLNVGMFGDLEIVDGACNMHCFHVRGAELISSLTPAGFNETQLNIIFETLRINLKITCIWHL